MAIVRFPHEEPHLLVVAAAVPAAADGILTVSTTISYPMSTIDKVEVIANTAGTARVVTLTPSAGAWTAGSTIRIAISGYTNGLQSTHPQYCTVKVPVGGFANATAACNAIRAAINARFDYVVATGAATVIITGASTGLNIGKSFIVQTFTDDPARTIAGVVTTAGVAPRGTAAQVQALLPQHTITLPHNLVKIHRRLTGDDGTSRKQVVHLWVDYSTTATLAQDIADAVTIGDTSAADESGAAQVIAV